MASICSSCRALASLSSQEAEEQEALAPQSHHPTPHRRTSGHDQRPSAAALGSIRSTTRWRFSEQSAQQASAVESAPSGARKPLKSGSPESSPSTPVPTEPSRPSTADGERRGSSTRSKTASAATNLAEAVSPSKVGASEATRVPTARKRAHRERKASASAWACSCATAASSGDTPSSASVWSSSPSDAYRAKISSNFSLNPAVFTLPARPRTSSTLLESSSALRASTSERESATESMASGGNVPKQRQRQPAPRLMWWASVSPSSLCIQSSPKQSASQCSNGVWGPAGSAAALATVSAAASSASCA
mmetsp:Transcript_103559/g.269760  ORF Transcript_103559/g.269760 Transcript_103559/m.269760 type:complete len:307 (-) Transcript_103559:439-1359(-)